MRFFTKKKEKKETVAAGITILQTKWKKRKLLKQQMVDFSLPEFPLSIINFRIFPSKHHLIYHYNPHSSMAYVHTVKLNTGRYWGTKDYNSNSIEKTSTPFSFLNLVFILKPQSVYSFIARTFSTLTFNVIT